MHATNSVNVPFAVLGVDGNPDLTTPANVSSGNSNIRVGILGDGRTLFIDGLSVVNNANAILSVIVGGTTFQDPFLVTVAPAPNRGGISAGATASAEYQTPASR